MEELRLYTFINFYLSSIQQGIQTAHIVHDLMLKYQVHSSGAAKLFTDWARNHKTIIVLNGGGTAEIEQAVEVLREQSQYPWAEFYESRECLSAALTGVGVVLPERVFNAGRVPLAVGTQYFERPNGEQVLFGDVDYAVIDLVKSKGLAR